MSSSILLTSSSPAIDQLILMQVQPMNAPEEFSEDPCLAALSLFTSMSPEMDRQFERETEKTMMSVHKTFQALGQHFQELSKQNKILREKLQATIKQQRTMAASHSTEIATLQQTSKTAKAALQNLKKMANQLPNKVKERVHIATANQMKAVEDAKAAGKSQIDRLKAEYTLTRKTALNAQATVFQSDLLNLKDVFQAVETTYQISRAQLIVEERAAHRACQNPKGHTLEDLQRGLREFYVYHQLSSRMIQNCNNQTMFGKILSKIQT